MKTILVPTDFSANAETAMNFAMVIARGQNAEIVLLHVIQAPAPGDPVIMNILHEAPGSPAGQAHLRLEALAAKIRFSGLEKFSTMVGEGDAVAVINKAAGRINADLIIMGARGTSDRGDFIFGSTASEVIEQSIPPVIAVPEDTKVGKQIRNITYASRLLKSDIPSIATVAEIAAPFGASVTVLHISENEEIIEEESKRLGDMINKITDSVRYEKLGFQMISGEDVVPALQQYVQKSQTDMLVLSTQYRNYFGRLFGRSITRKMMHTIDIPVVAFHHHKPMMPVNIYG
jgi:nucleotide-binding universal stress UspA family protein